jgi:WD40 repeat protein
MGMSFGSRLVFALGVALATLFVRPSAAAEPPASPILQLEVGTHIARIGRIATDRDGRFVATASDDKTLRLWDRQSGRLLQVLRVPQAAGGEGRLSAVAVSPDGQWIATGGWTGHDWDGSNSIYIFQRSSGRIVRRIPGSDGAINSLAWSPDGLLLGAVHLGTTGLRVYRTRDFSLVGADRYEDQAYGIAFAKDGRLATASLDGHVRIYRVAGDDLRLLAKRAVDGKRPYHVAFSPDARMLAVASTESLRIDVLSSDDLSSIFSPDLAGVPPSQPMFAIAWSSDGNQLYAGGHYRQGAQRVIRIWERGGRVFFRDVPVAENTIMHIVPTASGVIYGAFDGWGSIDNAGTRERHISPSVADFRNSGEHFRLSRDAQVVGFGFKLSGRDPARFDLSTGVLKSAQPSTDLLPARVRAPAIDVVNWQNRRDATVNGRAVKLDPYEMSRSIAIAPDGESLLLGAEWNLYRFKVDGSQVWRAALGGPAWAVNLSADGKLAVAALGDGTIRWYRYSDGKPLLSFFPHADQKRWVVWSPSGYYDASPGAEDLVGWHLNRGKENAADFFPASRFRSQFYRPDVIAKMLGVGDEREALRLADAERGRQESAPTRVEAALPPVVEIISPGDGSTVSQPKVTLRYAVRVAEDAPAVAIRARVNGQPIVLSDGRNLVLKTADTREVSIPIPEADSEIMLFAENRHGISTPATLRVKWQGVRPTAARDDFAVLPKLYVLAVGVSEYELKTLRLRFAAKDATDFAQALRGQKGRLYRDVELRVLTDNRATKDEILDGLDWIRQQVTSKDFAMVFLAGHGVNDPDGRYYFLPSNTDPDRLRRTALLFHEIRDTLNTIPGKTLLFVDTCHSGNVLGTGRRSADMTGVLNELASAENGVVAFTAATGRQYSLENAAWGNGAFTKAVIEGLMGRADYRNTGRITFKMLDYYVSERVKELTRNEQTPVTIVPSGVPDFPIAMTPAGAASR